MKLTLLCSDAVKGRFLDKKSDWCEKAVARFFGQGAFDVTQKQVIPPGVQPQDYCSVGPYWWPDPNQKDGIPYIRRDGETNPESQSGNVHAMKYMAAGVHALVLSWARSGNLDHAEAAANQLRQWFLDESTGMYPHLEFAQAIPGHCDGRGIGIIETGILVFIPDDATLLLESGYWSSDDHQRLQDWFRKYLSWLLCSEKGRDEAGEHNNHGTWFDAQVMIFAFFCGWEDLVHNTVEYRFYQRLETQLEPDGSQPHELERTLSWAYSIFNILGILASVLAARRVGIDLNDWRGTRGQQIQRSVEFLLDYAPNTGKEWKWPQIKPREDLSDGWFDGAEIFLQRSLLVYQQDTAFCEKIRKQWKF